MQVRYLFFFWLLISPFYLFAQANSCGATPNSLQFQQYKKQLKQAKQHRLLSKNSKVYVPVKIHIGRRTNGTGGISMDIVRADFERANEAFADLGIEFFICGKANFINNTQWYENGTPFSVAAQSLFQSSDLPNHINVHYNDILRIGSGELCGYAFYPYGREQVFMANHCTGPDNNILIHELGHYFYLFHTHGLLNNERTKELVDGSNCDSTGDLLCDTPADPNLEGKVSDLCHYQPTFWEVDANGDSYEPMEENYMSYSLPSCINTFTPEQSQVMNYFKNFARRNLILHQKPTAIYFENLPKRGSVTDLPILLEGYPAGGTFSGSGVIGDYFDPIIAGPGVFTIQYQYDGAFPQIERADQHQQLVLEKRQSLEELQWQSFRPSLEGLSTKIDVILSNQEAGKVVYSIRNGIGTDGEILYENTAEIEILSNQEWVSLPIEETLFLEKGRDYTITLQNALETEGSQLYWLGALWDANEQIDTSFQDGVFWQEREYPKFNTYARGKSSLELEDDFSFVTYIEAEEDFCGKNHRSYDQKIILTGRVPENGIIAPNPVKDVLKINYRVLSPLDVHIQMFDIQGRLIYEHQHLVENIGRHTDEINTTSLPQGVYICQMRFGEEEKVRRVLVGY